MKSHFFAVTTVVFMIVSCQSEKKEDTTPVKFKESFNKVIEAKNEEVKLLMEKSCLYCHRLQPIEGEEELAPLMQTVIDVYKSHYPKKEDFVKAIVDYTVNPDPKKSLMQGAIEVYKPMPNSGIIEVDAKDIALYLYDYKFQ